MLFTIRAGPEMSRIIVFLASTWQTPVFLSAYVVLQYLSFWIVGIEWPTRSLEAAECSHWSMCLPTVYLKLSIQVSSQLLRFHLHVLSASKCKRNPYEGLRAICTTLKLRVFIQVVARDASGFQDTGLLLFCMEGLYWFA